MRNWFTKLMAFLARRDRTLSPRRMDWHGRALAESTEGAIPQVSVSEGPLYATLCLPSFDDAGRQTGLSGHGDQKSEMKP
jgi:hypothetical protein